MVLRDSKTIRSRVFQSAVMKTEGRLTTLTFHAMGTLCRISLVETPTTQANPYFENTLNWVADFEAKFSRFLDNSLINRINKAAGREWVEIDPETERLLAMCGEFRFFSRGVFDPTSLPLIRLWNWKANPSTLPSAQQIADTRELVGWSLVQLKPGVVFLPRTGMCLDLGGIGKEYAVDFVAQTATQYHINDVLVDFGQDIRASGHAPSKPAWHIGLENPQQPGSCWASLAITGSAVATSGDYLRHSIINGRRYGHIIDPRTGYPVENECRAVSVVAPSCTLAGILSTTAFILGPREGYDLIQQTFGAAGAILTSHEKIITPRLHEHLVQLNSR